MVVVCERVIRHPPTRGAGRGPAALTPTPTGRVAAATIERNPLQHLADPAVGGILADHPHPPDVPSLIDEVDDAEVGEALRGDLGDA